jgi:co-chaperonin GroES (HSP10)
MKLQPLGNKIAVVRLKNEDTTLESGLILTKSLSEVDKAKVIAVGPDAKDVVVGNTILIDWKKATQSTFENIPVYMLKDEDVVGIYE